ncbi:SUI1 family translation initiation factor [Paenibacillus glufosinatiresistens]|uniref:hypothetical protein n=1 Tax=Paenibacillus glufosinatiresistens TaxID=3070657 RepID=UPI00286E3D3B|nr:hypothetical protein [Paenibacillus sp. YX.27]
MYIKRVMIVGTMMVAMTFGGNLGGAAADSASPVAKIASGAPLAPAGDGSVTSLLRLSSKEELYEALYDGRSLADIADSTGASIGPVIDLQVAQLAGQLKQRLDSGSISERQYRDHLAELRSVLTESALRSY